MLTQCCQISFQIWRYGEIIVPTAVFQPQRHVIQSLKSFLTDVKSLGIIKYNMYFILFILAVSDVSIVINWEVVFLFTVKVMVSVSHRLYIKPP